METRQITQYRIYALRMNHVADRAESIRTVASTIPQINVVEETLI